MENYTALLLTAVTIGVVHTVAGPDHYLPFVALSKSRNWTMVKTVNIVIISGLAHVLSSVIIGFIGIGAGIGLSKLELFEGFRGNVAAWLLFSFGVAYTAWAVFRLIRRKVLKSLTLESKNYDLESEILIKASRKGFKIASVPVKTIYKDERSYINPIKDTLRFVGLILRIRAK